MRAVPQDATPGLPENWRKKSVNVQHDFGRYLVLRPRVRSRVR